MNFEETITQSKVRLLRTSNSIEMDPHPKFGSSIETDDHTHTHAHRMKGKGLVLA